MTQNISRRDFLKLAGTGIAVTTALTGCGPASRYTTREPYLKMPEYNYNGQSTYYATTCRECPAGCGIVVRTMQGRALKVEGNPIHPINQGKTCARGQNAVHGLYNPDRIQQPGKRARGAASLTNIEWDEAILTVANALKSGSVAFLSGLANDHVFDLATEIATAIGAPKPVRFSALEIFESQGTLREAAKQVFGTDRSLYFDLANADVAFSFGAGFLETWQNPVAGTRAFGKHRRGDGVRGYLVAFEPRMSQTAMKADEWIPVAPGTEGLVASAIGKLVSALKSGASATAFASTNVDDVSKLSGVSVETLNRLANIFANAKAPLALPPSTAAGAANGLASVVATLNLNALMNNLGVAGGVYLSPAPALATEDSSANYKQMQDFVSTLASGKVKTLFIHGLNPVFEIPASLGFTQSLSKVSQVISFSSFVDETSSIADFVFPDHTALESFGYQRVKTNHSLPVLSGVQPVVAPFYNTMSTVDVLLAASAKLGGKAALPYKDEVEFVQAKIAPLMDTAGGYFSASEPAAFWASFQQFGGWWMNDSALTAPTLANTATASLDLTPTPTGEGELLLHTYVSPILGESGANKPWLQEVPDPTTTVMWNTWMEINPKTAEEMGLENDDVVKVVSGAGEIEVSVLTYKAIRPDVIAIPFGQGHKNNGRYANNRGANPADLFGTTTNQAGDLVYSSQLVKIEKTGKTAKLSRMEGYTKLEHDLGAEH